MASLVDNPTVEAFDALVASTDRVVIDFSASWCAPCKSFTPKFHRAARELRRRAPEGSFAFVTIDIDFRPELAKRFGVRSVPTTVIVGERTGLFRKGKGEVGRFSGDKPAEAVLRELARAVGVEV